MNKNKLPDGIRPSDHFLAQHNISVTVLHSAEDGSATGLVALQLGVTEARAPDGRRVTLAPVRMTAEQARTLAAALPTRADIAEANTQRPPSSPH